MRRPQTSDDSRLCQAVSAKLEDGNLRAAIRLLMSDDIPATPSAKSLSTETETPTGFTQGCRPSFSITD